MNSRPPEPFYQQQIQKHTSFLRKLTSRRSLLGWSRLIVFIATVIISYKIFAAAGLAGLAPALLGTALFLYLVFIDAANNEKIVNTEKLIHINEQELQIMSNKYLHRDEGSSFAPSVHDYANDLDLFGKASLFQWANRCSSEQGKNLLAGNLLHPLSVPQIEKRQEAIKELAPMAEWRQQFQSFSEQTRLTIATEQKTNSWLAEEEKHFTAKGWKLFVWLYTLLSLSSAAATIMGYIPSGTFLFLFAWYFIISLFLSRNTIKPYLQLTRIVEEITILEKLITWMESKDFRSALPNQIKAGIRSGNENASVRIRQLKSILDRFDLRLNIVGPLFLNSFSLWDVRQMMALNEWRRKNRQVVPELFRAIAEMEVLNSLASIHFNYPDWCLPELVNEHFLLQCKELGHPLIAQAERIDNDFRVEKPTLVSLVTGSNMAGKSTFLRSIGVNMVLAQMGAPVCAKSFTVSSCRLMTSMRISDNLAENTSTFYAELKKLKTIIEAVNKKERVFALLDEMLRGTNSHDRHTGSAAFISQLINQQAYAVIATHDLELAELEKKYPGTLRNFHFDVQVKGEELFFDYKLKEGICHSLNASLLMKKIGIELPQS